MADTIDNVQTTPAVIVQTISAITTAVNLLMIATALPIITILTIEADTIGDDQTTPTVILQTISVTTTAIILLIIVTILLIIAITTIMATIAALLLILATKAITVATTKIAQITIAVTTTQMHKYIDNVTTVIPRNINRDHVGRIQIPIARVVNPTLAPLITTQRI